MKFINHFAYWLAFVASVIQSSPLSTQNATNSSNPANQTVIRQENMKIIGGEPVKVGEAPWQVALFSSGNFHCGGSLIELDKVLTAAHCVHGSEDSPSKFFIRYGTLYRASGSDIKVARIISHPNYSSSTIDYDVAILLLVAPIEVGVNAAVIPLAQRPPESGSEVTVSGWGLTTSQPGSSTLPLYLQQASDLTVMSQAECQDRWDHVISDRMLCAWSKRQSSCNGDSGGPMSQDGTLVGVVSWGSSWCLHPTHPNVYSNVSDLREWIVNVTKTASSNHAYRLNYFEFFSLLMVTVVQFLS